MCSLHLQRIEAAVHRTEYIEGNWDEKYLWGSNYWLTVQLNELPAYQYQP